MAMLYYHQIMPQKCLVKSDINRHNYDTFRLIIRLIHLCLANIPTKH